MTGYQEVLTDPSYKDQIIVFTYPLIGNYGINESDFESKKPHVAGVIVYEGSRNPSHYKSAYSLQEYLQKWNIPLLGHMDTRSIVKKIRSEGSMPAKMSSSETSADGLLLPKDEKVCKVSSQAMECFGEGSVHIVVMDFGAKKSIVDSLLKRACKVTSVPYNTNFEQIKKLNPDGVVLSNGPEIQKN